MTIVGVRELRQNASEILKEVEAGHPVTVTVQGRPVAQLTPLNASTWTTWDRIRGIFASANDPTWQTERRTAIGDDVANPWER